MTRDEAIGRIKARFDKWALDDEDMKAIQTLIPELSESEDERIRKLLVWQVYRNIEDETNDLAQSVYDGIKGHDPDIEESIEDWKKCLVYLEKQKENPKTADSITPDCTSDAKCEDRWHKVSDSLPDNPREVLCKDEAGNYFIGRYYTGEGWEISNYDDEDKPHHLNPPVSKWIDFPSEKQKEPENTSASTMAPSCWEVEQKEQKQEWSEDDKAIVGSIACYLDGQFIPEGARRQCQEWFNRHRRDFLNRPSWKPSEEQMEALERASTNKYLSAKQFDILVSLHEDLNKL